MKEILRTERLILREFNENDSPFIFILLNNPTWILYIGDRNIKTMDDAKNYLNNGPIKSYADNGFGLYKVELTDNTPIGMCGLIKRETLEDVDIGFALLPEYVGKGYAYEIASATMTHAKEKLGLEKIVAITTPDNTHSIKLLNRIGLQYEKMIRLAGDEEELMLLS